MAKIDSWEHRIRQWRWRIQHRIGDALHAIDRATGSVLERRILCGVLDMLGADGTCAFLNEDSVHNLQCGIFRHTRDCETRRVAIELERACKRQAGPAAAESLDELLKRVLVRLGPEGELRLRPLPDGLPLMPVVEVRWRRSHDGVVSDWRCLDDAWGLEAALHAVLRWEDAADAEERRSNG